MGNDYTSLIALFNLKNVENDINYFAYFCLCHYCAPKQLINMIKGV